MKVLILGAAGQVAGLLRDNLLKETSDILRKVIRNLEDLVINRDIIRKVARNSEDLVI